jgi:hypothetical protein
MKTVWKAPKAVVKRIERLFDSCGSDWDRWFDNGDAYTPGERLFFVMYPSQHGDREAADQFWSRIDDARPNNWKYVQEFAESVLD